MSRWALFKGIRTKSVCGVFFLFGNCIVLAQTNLSVAKFLEIDFPLISEMSGLAKSQDYEDIFWTHNDSGDSSRLFALDSDGELIFPAFLKRTYHGNENEQGKEPWPGLTIQLAANIDWEDIAVSDGLIYIADLGNNANARRDLGIYIVNEPNPRSISQTRPLQFIPVRYPDQNSFPPEEWRFDSEAIFIHEGAIYILTKHRGRGIYQLASGTNLYRLSDWRTDQINVLEKIDSHSEMFFVTASDLSPDNDWLAVVGYTELWLFPAPGMDDKWLSGDARRLSLSLDFSGSVEAITWIDQTTLLLGNEGGSWFKVNVEDIPLHDGESRSEDGMRQIRRRSPVYR